jgi:AbrB family looped-hinge helix DNA binding protein
MFPKLKLWGIATVGNKGQIVIPSDARNDISIKEGDKLLVLGKLPNGGLMLVKADSIEAMLQHMQKDLEEMRKSTKKTKGK